MKHFTPVDADDARVHANFCQPLICVVGAQRETILGPRREHAIGLAHAPRHEIIDHHADIRAAPIEDERIAPRRKARRVETCNQPLSRSLFIACRAVDLARQIKPRQALYTKRRIKLARIDIVVFDRIAEPLDLDMLKPVNLTDESFLHILRQRRRNPVRIDRVAILRTRKTFRLEEDLVFVAIGKPLHLVLDRRAIARTTSRDRAGIDRRLVQVVADHRVDLGRRPGDPARNLRHRDPVIQERERDRLRIRFLHLQIRPVDARCAKPRRRPRLQPAHLQAQPIKTIRQPDRRRLADASRRNALLADMDQPFEERPCRHHDSARAPRPARKPDDAGHPAFAIRRRLDDQILNSVLDQGEVGVFAQDVLHRFAIEFPVRLCPGPAHRRPLGPVEHPELDAAAIRRPAHHAVQGIDFPNQMPLAQPANGRVARHLANGRKLVGDQRGLRPEPRRGRRGLGPGMSATDHDDVEGILEIGTGHGSAAACGWKAVM